MPITGIGATTKPISSQAPKEAAEKPAAAAAASGPTLDAAAVSPETRPKALPAPAGKALLLGSADCALTAAKTAAGVTPGCVTPPRNVIQAGGGGESCISTQNTVRLYLI